MAITAAQVKELRERTGSGMMECKKSLLEVGGDVEAAVELLRKAGLAKADKKAGRVAAEGLIHIGVGDGNHTAVAVEVNCETDFVTKKDEFKDFVKAVAHVVLSKKPESLDALLEMTLDDGSDSTVELARKGLIAKIGENIQVRRFIRLHSESGVVASYLHGTRIGVLVELQGGDENLAKDIAMHIAASNPMYLSEKEVSAEYIDKEKEILLAQAEGSGKPPEIVEKMVQGRIKKLLGEITLVGQPFVKDPDQTVEQMLKASQASVVRYERIELGEGIEKKDENFADEVMAQVRGA